MEARWKAQCHEAVSTSRDSLLTPRTRECWILGEVCSNEGALRCKFSLLQLRRDNSTNVTEARMNPYLISNQLLFWLSN